MVKATGYDLRGSVEAFQDVLTEVGAFLEEMEVEDAEGLLEKARDAVEGLFYVIPLEEE